MCGLLWWSSEPFLLFLHFSFLSNFPKQKKLQSSPSIKSFYVSPPFLIFLHSFFNFWEFFEKKNINFICREQNAHLASKKKAPRNIPIFLNIKENLVLPPFIGFVFSLPSRRIDSNLFSVDFRPAMLSFSCHKKAAQRISSCYQMCHWNTDHPSHPQEVWCIPHCIKTVVDT